MEQKPVQNRPPRYFRNSNLPHRSNIVEIVKQVSEEMKRDQKPKPPAESVTTQPAVKEKQNKQKKNKTVVKREDEGHDAIARIAKQVHTIITEPQLALMLGCIFLVLYVYHFHTDESIISRAAASLKASPATSPFGKWLEENVPTFFGILTATATSFMTSTKYGVSLAVSSVLLIIIMPSVSVTFYVITSLFFLLMTRLKTAVDRYIIVAIAVFVYLYFIADSKISAKLNSDQNTTKTTKA